VIVRRQQPSSYSGHPFEPDILLPDGEGRAEVPEKRLMLGILQDAIFCFRQYRGASDGPSRRFFREAESWLMSDGRDWAFSFVSICDVLGFDPTYVRRGLREWDARRLASARGESTPRQKTGTDGVP
jgi:hypothetical protein